MRFRLAVIAATALAAVTFTAASASAEYGPTAVYQVTLSFNCNNPSFCGSDGLGGFWGWAVFNNDGTADAELTGCGHIRGVGGGAGHMSVDASGWFIGPNGDFFISSEDVTFVGHGPPVTVHNPEPPYPSDTGIPATPGHYTATDVFGFQPPPGVAIQIQVTKIPNR